MLPPGRTTIDLLRTSTFLVQLVPGPAISKVKVEHCNLSKNLFQITAEDCKKSTSGCRASLPKLPIRDL